MATTYTSDTLRNLFQSSFDLTQWCSFLLNFFRANELKKIPEIVEAHFTTGSYSVIVKLYARDNEHLMTLLNEHIQEIPGVTNTETMISLDQSIKKELPISID